MAKMSLAFAVALLSALLLSSKGYEVHATCTDKLLFKFHFQCPGPFDSKDKVFCCGESGSQYCCNNPAVAIMHDTINNIESNMGTIIGIVAGVLGCVILLCALCCYCCCCRRRQPPPYQPIIISAGSRPPSVISLENESDGFPNKNTNVPV